MRSVLESKPTTFSDIAELDEAAYRAFDLTIGSLSLEGEVGYNRRAFQDEKQPVGDYSRTFMHEIRVGGLLHAAGARPEVVISGALHDAGKSNQEIRNIITQERSITADERLIVARHAEFGSQELQGALVDPELNEAAAFAAANHHTLRPAYMASTHEGYLWGVTSLVHVADKAESMLVDWEGRLAYKADRMTSEGLIDAQGRPVMSKIIEDLLGIHAGKAYMGVKTADIVELATSVMPDADYIQQGVQEYRNRRNAA